MAFLCAARTLLGIPVNALGGFFLVGWFCKIVMRRGDEERCQTEQRNGTWDREGPLRGAQSGSSTGSHPASQLMSFSSCALLCSWPAGAFQLPGTGFASVMDMSSVQQPEGVYSSFLCGFSGSSLVAAAPSVTE